jgi:hypothetical protein
MPAVISPEALEFHRSSFMSPGQCGHPMAHSAAESGGPSGVAGTSRLDEIILE